jgi:hypothetical protein
MLTHVNMIEVPGTSFNATDRPGVAQFTTLLAAKTAPVFEASPADEKRVFSEVVAVTYRGADGKPVHGGLFGFGADGVTSLALKDLEGKVDTSKDPAHVAFGVIMMRGPLVFRQNGADHEMALSIIDIHADKPDEPLHASTPARVAVKDAYLSDVRPIAGGAHCEPQLACPANARHAKDIVGCGSTNVSGPDHEGLHDCHECGLFFNPLTAY